MCFTPEEANPYLFILFTVRPRVVNAAGCEFSGYRRAKPESTGTDYLGVLALMHAQKR